MCLEKFQSLSNKQYLFINPSDQIISFFFNPYESFNNLNGGQKKCLSKRRRIHFNKLSNKKRENIAFKNLTIPRKFHDEIISVK